MDQELDGKEKVGMEKEEMMEIGAGEQNGRGPDNMLTPDRPGTTLTRLLRRAGAEGGCLQCGG